MPTPEQNREMMTFDERVKFMGLNEALEDTIFAEDTRNKAYIKDFLERYKGTRPFLGLAAEQIMSGQGKYMLHDGVDYKKFDSMLLDLKETYENAPPEEPIEEKKEEQSRTVGIDVSGSSISGISVSSPTTWTTTYTQDAISVSPEVSWSF